MGGVLDEGQEARQEWLQKKINESRFFSVGLPIAETIGLPGGGRGILVYLR